MFLDEIKKSLKIENMEFASPVVTVFGKVGAAIEGHKGLLYFSDEEIRFKVKKPHTFGIRQKFVACRDE